MCVHECECVLHVCECMVVCMFVCVCEGTFLVACVMSVYPPGGHSSRRPKARLLVRHVRRGACRVEAKDDAWCGVRRGRG